MGRQGRSISSARCHTSPRVDRGWRLLDANPTSGGLCQLAGCGRRRDRNMTAVPEQVERVLKPIQQFVRGWMTGAPADRLATELGMRSGEDVWIVGRAGVLGDGDADVATAGLAFLAPARVRAAWESLPPGLSHGAVADAYAASCCRWGAATLCNFDRARIARRDELGRAIGDAADPSLGAVFAGWRAQPRPDDVNAR